MQKIKRFKKMLALVLTLAMLASMCLINAIADNETQTPESNGWVGPITYGELATYYDKWTKDKSSIVLGIVRPKGIIKFGTGYMIEFEGETIETYIEDCYVSNLYYKYTKDEVKNPTLSDTISVKIGTTEWQLYTDKDCTIPVKDSLKIKVTEQYAINRPYLTPDANVINQYIYFKNTPITAASTRDSQFVCPVSPGYTVTIPTTVAFNKLQNVFNVASLDITTSNVVIENGKQITITPSASTVTLTHAKKSGETLTANLYIHGTGSTSRTSESSEINPANSDYSKYSQSTPIKYAKSAGTITDQNSEAFSSTDTQNILVAITKSGSVEPGTYSGTITFTLTYEDIPKETEAQT